MAEPPAGTTDPGTGARGGYGGSLGITIDKTKPVSKKSKSISYKSGNSDQIYSLAETTSATVPSVSMPRAIEVKNTGSVTLMIMVGYKTYSAEATIVAHGGESKTRYIHYMLMPGDSFFPLTRGVIMTDYDANVTQFDGTVVDNATPNSNMYTDSTAKTTEGFADDDDTTIGFDDASGGVAHTMFKENDLIRLDDEVCRIKSIVDTAGDGDYTPAHFIVERAVHGTAKADHTNNTAIRFTFFNAYGDFDKDTTARTDGAGKFKCFNMFGVGRSAGQPSGIVPSSFAMKFYDPGFCRLGLSGQTSSSETSLTAGGSYFFKIAIDGGTAENHNFTVDSSNTKWGNTNGVLSLINDALEDKYNNSASNTFQQKSSVAIENGDVVFRSGQGFSNSAIELTAGAGGASDHYNLFTIQSGHIPALANVPDPVDAKLPDDNLYDSVTYATIPNSSVFGYDDGYGRLFGMCSGTINYETGAIDMRGCPVNAEFVYSVAHTSAFSGKLGTSTTVKGGTLTDILANTPSQKWNGFVEVSEF